VHLPADVASAVEDAASAFPFRDLARAAAGISERYRGDRPRTGRLTPLECAAWAAVRMPATFAATRAVIGELLRRAPEVRIESVLDLGAGTGAGVRAASELLPLGYATAMEQDAALRALGARLASGARWLERDIRIGPPFPVHDLVLLGWVAGELDSPAREHVLDRAWQSAQRALIMIEPGTTRGFEIVRSARRQLLGAGAFLAAPCPAADECAAPDGEWCHFAARVERTALHRRLKAGELSYEDEKYCYLIATRAPVMRAEQRVVRHPRHEPGLIRLQLCNGDVWQTLEVRKRDKTRFRRARKAQWGDEWVENEESRI
jgi:ribosomal protein RSM22 (predicted rRNA methylase)